MPLKTVHRIIFEDARDMGRIPKESADLVVTSPPYPMIEMWDSLFCGQCPGTGNALKNNRGIEAFEEMHRFLDPVWDEVHRILKTGGFACINVGDAVRTVGRSFMLYPNHSRILSYFLKTGLMPLPVILWRKQTNAPNKFMGSGMLPAGAYVTLEHEYILILRKGGKRVFNKESEKRLRQESAVFWEERNAWYSDMWMDLKGERQTMKDSKARARSAAFPFEVPYRLINMYSVKGDTVVDPFLGTGTTMIAAAASARNSIGFEIETDVESSVDSGMASVAGLSNQRVEDRIKDHIDFIEDRFSQTGGFKHRNIHYGFPVVTAQEKRLLLNQVISVEEKQNGLFEAMYEDGPQKAFVKDWDGYFSDGRAVKKPKQLKLLGS